MVKVTFLDYGAGNIRSLRNALVKVGARSLFACRARRSRRMHDHRSCPLRPRANLIQRSTVAGWV